MIAAHSDPVMLQRLVRRLKSPQSRFLIHIDAKADAAPFHQLLDGEGVSFTSWRKKIWWVDYGLCRVALRMLTEALDEADIDRFFFMSGADYPIKSMGDILNVERGVDLIRVDRLLDAKSKDWFSQTAFRYHFLSGRLLNPRTAHPKVRLILGGLSRRLKRSPPRFSVYQGPSWWSLSRLTAEAIVSLTRKRPDILAWFRWSFCPEELLFQTLIKQVPGANISQDKTLEAAGQDGDSFHATHYVKFAGPSPRVLRKDDLQEVMESEALFARKFDSLESGELMDGIDRVLSNAR